MVKDKDQLTDCCFSKSISGLGSFHIRPLNLQEDSLMIHDWVNRDYAKYWGMSGTSLEDIEGAYRKILVHSKVFIGLFQYQPAFLLECYKPEEDAVGKCYDVQQGDCGMHILVAPANRPLANFTWFVFKTIMDFIFDDEHVKRIIVEPDVRNEKIHILNKRAGFEYQKIIELPGKKAYLAFCTRQQYGTAVAIEENKGY